MPNPLSGLFSPFLGLVRLTNVLVALGVAGIATNILVGEKTLHLRATFGHNDTLYGWALAWLAVSLLVQALGWCDTSQQGKRG
ncbi:MAG: hypothetical protein PHE17_16395 [Thiothrix sp.]|uniref:hypothetical protein n=1 Tax=Thiothrix sp. TaxID=1032 RepID=UPI0026095647|nr:hypothetical protein [Thiothrix sp.]MDD5394596.1 hypothetical protein [Thiothrix sp.]